MYSAISKVVPHKDFSLSIVFENGDNKILDMKPYLDFGIFKKIRNYEKFKCVRVAFDTIEWDDGVDLDPEFINAKSKPINQAYTP